MARIKNTDVSTSDPFSSLRKSAKKTIAVLNQMTIILKSNLETQKLSLKPLKSNRIEDLKKLSKAQREVKKTLSSINAVEKEKIAALEKLKKANSTKRKEIEQINLLTKEQLRLTKEEQKSILQKNGVIKKSAAEIRRLENEEKKLLIKSKKLRKSTLDDANAFKKLERQVNNAQSRFKRLSAQYGETDKRTIKALNTFTRLDNKLSRINKKARDGRRDVGRYATAFGKLGGILRGGIGLLGIGAGIGLVTRVIGGSIRKVLEFSKENSKLKAVLNATKEAMASLKQQQISLSSITIFTATQVTSLQISLAKLGFPIIAIKNMTAATLAGATALGSELGEQATLVGSTLRSFGIQAFKSAHVNDVLAKSAATTALDFSKLSTALPIVGATAKTAGVGLERVVALLGTLTNRGLDASMSATALRNIFLSLSKHGLTWNEAMIKLNSSVDKNKTAMELFGKRGTTAAIILSETKDEVLKLSTAFEEADGTAKRMAKTMTDNLSGDITIAKSAWEAFILSLENGKGALANFSRNVTQLFTKALIKMAQLARGFKQNLEIAITEANKNVNIELSKKIREAIKIRVDADTQELNQLRNQLEKKEITQIEYNKRSAKIGKDFVKFKKDENKRVIQNELRLNKEKQKELLKNNTDLFPESRNKKGFQNFSRKYLLEKAAKLKKSIPTDFTLGVLNRGVNGISVGGSQTFQDRVKKTKQQIEQIKQLLIIMNKQKGLTQDLNSLNEKQHQITLESLTEEIKGNSSKKIMAVNNKISFKEKMKSLLKEQKVIDEVAAKRVSAANSQIKNTRKRELAILDILRKAESDKIMLIQKMGIKKSELNKEDFAKLKEFTDKERKFRLAISSYDDIKKRLKVIDDLDIKAIKDETKRKKVKRQQQFDEDIAKLEDNGLLTNEIEIKLKKDLIADLKKIQDDADKEQKKKDIKSDKERYKIEKSDLKKKQQAEKEARDGTIKFLEEIDREYFKKKNLQADRELTNQQKRESNLQNLANRGIQDAKDSLAKNQKDQAIAEKKKEKLIQQEKNYQLALSLFKAFNSELDANPEKGPGAALIKAILTTTLLSATAAALPQFIEGTDEVGKSLGNPQLRGQDGYIIRADGKEQIWSEKDRKEVNYRGRNELKGIVNDFDSGLLNYALNSNTIGVSFAKESKINNELTKLMFINNKIVKAIEDKPVNMGIEVDELRKIVKSTIIKGNSEEITSFKL